MAALLQHRAASLIARIQTTGARGHCLVFKASRIASTSSASNGRKAHHTLRLKSDHLRGEVQAPVRSAAAVRADLLSFFRKVLKKRGLASSNRRTARRPQAVLRTARAA